MEWTLSVQSAIAEKPKGKISHPESDIEQHGNLAIGTSGHRLIELCMHSLWVSSRCFGLLLHSKGMLIQDLKHRGHQRTPSSLLCLSQSFLRSGLAVLNHSSQEALIPKRICEGGISSNTMKLEAKAMQCYDIYYYSVNKG